jgi:hypothetical protein
MLGYMTETAHSPEAPEPWRPGETKRNWETILETTAAGWYLARETYEVGRVAVDKITDRLPERHHGKHESDGKSGQDGGQPEGPSCAELMTVLDFR